MTQQEAIGHGMRAGSCWAWPLPTDATCASIARRLFKDAVAALRLEPEVLNDAVLMTSELAANTLHAATAHAATAHAATVDEDKGDRRGAACPELWLYLRGLGLQCELVCKVFDCYRGWLHGPPPGPAAVPALETSGRGLQIVHELSRGRWGHHMTRARLGGWALRGKAVWFAVPAPFAHSRLADVTGLRVFSHSAEVTAARRHKGIGPRQAAQELEAMLDERGVGSCGAGVACFDEPAAEMSVLAFDCGLTLRCRFDAVSLSGPGGYRESWSYADLVEAAEQTIRRYEELDSDQPEAQVERAAYVTA